MKEKVNRLAVLTKGIIKENPNLVLLLGTCPTLATTSSAFNGMGMGIAATAVLICSNIVISLLAKIIPDKERLQALSDPCTAPDNRSHAPWYPDPWYPHVP